MTIGRPPVGTVYCKVGTTPALIIFDRRLPWRSMGKVRFREDLHGSKWETGILTNLDPIRITRQ